MGRILYNGNQGKLHFKAHAWNCDIYLKIILYNLTLTEEIRVTVTRYDSMPAADINDTPTYLYEMSNEKMKMKKRVHEVRSHSSFL